MSWLLVLNLDIDYLVEFPRMNEICIKTLSSVFKNWICYLEFICVVHLEFAIVSLTLFKTSPDISGS